MNNRLREKGIDVCITETTNKDDVIKNRDWRKGRGGGVMIGIRNKMGKGNRKTGIENREIEKIGIRIKGKTKYVNIIGVL